MALNERQFGGLTSAFGDFTSAAGSIFSPLFPGPPDTTATPTPPAGPPGPGQTGATTLPQPGLPLPGSATSLSNSLSSSALPSFSSSLSSISPSSAIPSLTTPTPTSSPTPTLTPTSLATTSTPRTNLASTITNIVSATPSAASDNSAKPSGFLQNKALSATVFTLLAVVVLALLFVGFTCFMRRRRHCEAMDRAMTFDPVEPWRERHEAMGRESLGGGATSMERGEMVHEIEREKGAYVSSSSEGSYGPGGHGWGNGPGYGSGHNSAAYYPQQHQQGYGSTTYNTPGAGAPVYPFASAGGGYQTYTPPSQLAANAAASDDDRYSAAYDPYDVNYQGHQQGRA